VKSELFERRLTFDVAAYYIDWRNMQVQVFSPSGLGYYANALSSSSKGAEASIVWHPVPGLDLSANFSHTIATLSAPLPAADGVGAKGDPLPDTPDWTAQSSASYTFPVSANWHGLAGVSYRYIGHSAGFFPLPPVLRFEHPAYQVADLRVGLNNSRWSWLVYAKNINNSRGQSAEDNMTATLTWVTIIQPRTFGFSSAYSF
jgi:iron complex outermembrane receptor protein